MQTTAARPSPLSRARRRTVVGIVLALAIMTALFTVTPHVLPTRATSNQADAPAADAGVGVMSGSVATRQPTAAEWKRFVDANRTAPSAGRTISHAEWVRFQDANVVNTRASHGADVSLAWMRFMRENEPSGNVATQRSIAVHEIGFSAD